MQFLKPVERAIRSLIPKALRDHFRPSVDDVLLTKMAPIDLIVHVGAHWGEDAELYETLGAKTVLWIEADPATFQKLTAALSQRSGQTTHLMENALVSAEGGQAIDFHRFDDDGSSSSVYPSTDVYRARFPDSRETGEVVTLKTRSLPEILAQHKIDISAAGRAMLVVDVQGHELSVLKGLGDGLKDFHLCKSEVSRVPMYDGGALYSDVRAYFESMGFHLAPHRHIRVPRHGDVLFARV